MGPGPPGAPDWGATHRCVPAPHRAEHGLMIRAVAELWRDGNPRVLAFCAAGWVFDFFDLILFAFVQGMVARDLGLADAELGWVHGTTLAAAAAGGAAFGHFADRAGRRRALAASILCYAVGALATAAAQDFTSLLLARIVTGLGVGGEWGIGHAVVAEAHPRHLRNRAAALLQALSPVAMLLAAGVGLLVAPDVGWRACFVFGGAVPAALALGIRWFLRDRASEPDPPREARVGIGALFGPHLVRTSTVLLTVLVLHMTGFWCVYSWMPKALFREARLGPTEIFWFFAAMNGLHVVADVAFGVFADRWGRLRVFAAFALFFALAQLAVALSLGGLWGDPVVLGIALAFMGLGAGTWSCFGVLFAEHYPAHLRATAGSTFYNLARGVQLPIQAAMPALFAWRGSYAVALEIGAVCAVLSAVVMAALPALDRSAPEHGED